MIAGDERAAARAAPLPRRGRTWRRSASTHARAARFRARSSRARASRAACGSASMRDGRNGRHVAISAGVGLFSGGAQRTALVIIAPLSVKPSFGIGAVLPFREAEFLQRAVEKIAGVIAGEGPAVRLAPVRPGARPTTSRRAFGSPNEGAAPLNQVGSARCVLFTIGDEPRDRADSPSALPAESSLTCPRLRRTRSGLRSARVRAADGRPERRDR